MPEDARVPAAAGGIFAHFHVGGDAEERDRFGRVAVRVARAIVRPPGMGERGLDRGAVVGALGAPVFLRLGGRGHGSQRDGGERNGGGKQETHRKISPERRSAPL